MSDSSRNRDEAAAPMKVAYYIPLSDEWWADHDPEYAASAEYLERHPPPPPTPWWQQARWAIPALAARPFWLLGEGFESLGYAIANAAAWLFHINIRYEKSREDDADD